MPRIDIAQPDQPQFSLAELASFLQTVAETPSGTQGVLGNLTLLANGNYVYSWNSNSQDGAQAVSFQTVDTAGLSSLGVVEVERLVTGGVLLHTITPLIDGNFSVFVGEIFGASQRITEYYDSVGAQLPASYVPAAPFNGGNQNAYVNGIAGLGLIFQPAGEGQREILFSVPSIAPGVPPLSLQTGYFLSVSGTEEDIRRAEIIFALNFQSTTLADGGTKAMIPLSVATASVVL